MSNLHRSHMPRLLRLLALLLLLAPLLAVAAPSRAAPGDSLVSLGTLPGGVGSVAYGINDNAQIVGESVTASGPFRPFLYKNGAFTDLGILPGDNAGRAKAINKLGQATGMSYNATSSAVHAVLWSNGGISDLGTLPGYSTYSMGLGINSAGQVVGNSYSSSLNVAHAFLYANGHMTDLGALPTGLSTSIALGINDAGQIVGQSGGPRSGHAVLWSKGTITDLGTLPGGSYSAANAINNAGQIVGESGAPDGNRHAVLWNNGAISDLGALATGGNAVATAISAAGEVAGYATASTGAEHAFVYSALGGMTDLGVLPGGRSSRAWAINGTGQVVGESINADNSSHAFLYNPPGVTTLAADNFNRTLASGWGTATPGGPWSRAGDLSKFSVNGAAGLMRFDAPNTTLSQMLWGVSARDVDLTVRVAVSKLPNAGSSEIAYLVARRTGQSTEYHGRLRFSPDGRLMLVAEQWINGYNTLLGGERQAPGIVPAANTYYRLRMQVSGASPTTIRLKAWLDGQPQPAAWTYSVADNGAGLQTDGSIGLRGYLQTNATNAPVTIFYDDFTATSSGL